MQSNLPLTSNIATYWLQQQQGAPLLAFTNAYQQGLQLR
jgi:hypothetical protein